MPLKQKANYIKILVDTHEAALYTALGKIQLDDTVTIENVRLDIGDIHILQFPADTPDDKLSDIPAFSKLVIERKSVNDMISSVKDGRYREQKKRLLAWEKRAYSKGKYRRVCYILEGFLGDSKRHDKAASRLYWGAQTSTILRDGLPVFNTLDVGQTAELIMRLAHRLSDVKTYKDLFPHLDASKNIISTDPILIKSDSVENETIVNNSDNIKPIIFNSANENSNENKQKKAGGKLSSRATTTPEGIKIIEFENANDRDTGVRSVSPATPCQTTGIRRVKITPGNNDKIYSSNSFSASESQRNNKKKDVLDMETSSRLSYLDTIIKKKKSSNITPANCHVIMLAQIPGISVRSAEAIMSEFNGHINELFRYLTEAAAVEVIPPPGKKDKETGEIIPVTEEQIIKAQRKAHTKALKRLSDIIVIPTTTSLDSESINKSESETPSNNNKANGRRLGSVLALRLMEYLVTSK